MRHLAILIHEDMMETKRRDLCIYDDQHILKLLVEEVRDQSCDNL